MGTNIHFAQVSPINFEKKGLADLNWIIDPLNGNFQLQPGSPASDTGTAYFEWNGRVLVDLQPGNYLGTAPDMGAFEAESDGGRTNQPPVSAAAATPEFGLAPLEVQFDSTGSFDPDGTIAAYSWDFGDGNLSIEANPMHIYNNIGIYLATLTVMDDSGATGSDTVLITVEDPAQNLIHVESQTVARRGNQRQRGFDVILVTEQNNQPVAGVLVTAHYNGPTQGQTSGTTGPDGQVILRTDAVRNPQGVWCFEIVDLSKDGYVYDSSANVATTLCESN